MFTLPSLPPLDKSLHSAELAHPLNKLEEDKISQMVADLDLNGSMKEHYLTGWMGLCPLVMIRNYQDKRGTSNGFMLTRPEHFRFSVQAITFRIPKFLLWATFRRKPRTMALIAYQQLGENGGGLIQYRNILDAEMKETVNQQWRDINDYLGAACYQVENDYPLWQTLENEVTEDKADALANTLASNGKKLQKDDEFSGLWQGELFIATRPAGETSPCTSVMISWHDGDGIGSYLYGWLQDEQGKKQLALAIRLGKNEQFFTLNRFDAEHIQRAKALFSLVTHRE
ncbi:hypothetical protein [Hafnia paralvei]|uniref:hypothetical protein n=1 Tax=Hafnia paralvei TaxID=546367 RepID=UPI0010330691|nr:hypothetical protein [Hafnia paralvei]TBM27192.1 hypothetical protein EYY85_09825 [Hafnia paralvei]